MEYSAGSACKGKALSADPFPSQCFALTYGYDDDDGGASTASSGGSGGSGGDSRIAQDRANDAVLERVRAILRTAFPHHRHHRANHGGEGGGESNQRARVVRGELAALVTDLAVDDDAGDDYYYLYDDYYSDNGDDWLAPPPSVSTTPFPTTAGEADPQVSVLMTCQAAPPRRTVSFTARQVPHQLCCP